MAGHRQPPIEERPALQAVRRGRLGGWRLAAVLVAVAAISLVYVARFGLPDLAAPAGSPRPSPTRAGVGEPTPRPSALDGPTLGPQPTGPIHSFPIPGDRSPSPTPVDPTFAPDRYADGVPARIGDETVLRVARLESITPLPAGQPLVGGWYRDGRLYDYIGRPYHSAGVALRGVGAYLGPLVVRLNLGAAHLRPEGPLEVDEVVWTGDLQTDSEPIGALPLLHQLVRTHYGRDPLGVDPIALELSDVGLRCPAIWPRHTYAAASGPVRLALIFPSPIERVIAEPAVTQSQYPSADPPSPACPHPVVRDAGRTRWVVDGNVMLLIRGGAYNTGLARQALSVAREQSARPERPWRPLTAWQALRGLWSVYPDLDVAPAAEEVFCVLDLPEESWSLRHDQLRGMAVFDSTAEREEFQATTQATDVRLEQGGCTGLGGQRRIDADARWLGKENVLLLVTGPTETDDQLLRALPRTTMRVWWP